MQARHRQRLALTLPLLLILLLLLLFAGFAGRMLVINAPEHADAIIVLNGGTSARTSTGLQLLEQGWAPRLILDVDATAVEWGVPDDQLAREWIAKLPSPYNQEVSTCPSAALSTRAEALLTRGCLQGARRILIVTSAYHTRRSLAIFRQVDSSRHFSAAAATEPAYFGLPWWRNREWAKTTAAEWCKLLWWYAVDRWR